MDESELVLEDVGMPNSGPVEAEAPVSQESGFVTILRTLPSRAMGVAATRSGENAERVDGLLGGASALAEGVEGRRAGESVSVCSEALEPEVGSPGEGLAYGL